MHALWPISEGRWSMMCEISSMSYIALRKSLHKSFKGQRPTLGGRIVTPKLRAMIAKNTKFSIA